MKFSAFLIYLNLDSLTVAQLLLHHGIDCPSDAHSKISDEAVEHPGISLRQLFCTYRGFGHTTQDFRLLISMEVVWNSREHHVTQEMTNYQCMNQTRLECLQLLTQFPRLLNYILDVGRDKSYRTVKVFFFSPSSDAHVRYRIM